MAKRQVARLEHAAMATKVDKVLEQQDKTRKTTNTLTTALEKLSQQQSQQLIDLDERVESSTSRTSQAVGLTNDLLRKLVEDVQVVRYQMSNSGPSRALDPTKNLPVLLEDPLGYHLTVPMDWINSWEVKTTDTARGSYHTDTSYRAFTVYCSCDLRNSEKARSLFGDDSLPWRITPPVWILIGELRSPCHFDRE